MWQFLGVNQSMHGKMTAFIECLVAIRTFEFPISIMTTQMRIQRAFLVEAFAASIKSAYERFLAIVNTHVTF
jgi:hypothetical protein